MANRRGIDVLLAVSAWLAPALIALVFAWIVGDMLSHGAGRVSWEFLTTKPLEAGRAGGILPILVSTLLILAVCLAASIPLGLGTAVLLAEFTANDGWFGRVVRRSLDVLAGVPSIVFGLFGNALFCHVLRLGRPSSILAGGLTLACMVLPLLIRATEEGFRSVPRDYRLGAAALGLSRFATLRHLLLPAALPGLLVGVVLGIARALAETAALLFTSGSVDRMPESLLDSGRSLSIHIYNLTMNISGGNPNAYASAVVLVSLLLLINSAASWLAQRWFHRTMVTA